MTGSARIIRGNALALPLADASVDLVVTSPPYFGLRSYQDDGAHYAGQIGSEPTPAEFVDALIAATREMVRVLKPSGSIFVNLGDKYAGAPSGPRNIPASHGRGGDGLGSSQWQTRRSYQADTPTKSLMGIPWRYALRCIDTTAGVPVPIVREMVAAVYNGTLDPRACDEILREYEAGGRNAGLGLILRAEIIWAKPNGLPESVTDRVRRSHEQWFHMVKQPRYYSAVDEIREEHAASSLARFGQPFKAATDAGSGPRWTSETVTANPLGKLPDSVWTIPDGVSPIRDILEAVSAGALTPEEGERLWTGLSDSSRMSINPATAGSGLDIATLADTAKPPQATAVRTVRTGSATDSSSARSLTASPSTTSAATSPASGPTTSSPSPDARTSDEPTPNEHTAPSDIPWLTPTLRSHLLDTPTNGAESAPAKSSDDSDSSVWNVPTQPLKVPPELGIDHFAAFPFEFPRRIIQGWSPAGVCTVCGEGRRPVTNVQYLSIGDKFAGGTATAGRHRSGTRMGDGSLATITGYACGCPAPTAPTRPAVILDPFGGTGTTALVAKALGRTGISVDMSGDYARLAQWRCNDPGQMAAALQVERPETVPPDQLDLFSLAESDSEPGPDLEGSAASPQLPPGTG